MPMKKCWTDVTWVAFDIETSGKYPLNAEICEIAAVKWQGGELVDKFQSLVRISRPMPAEVIAIHNITDSMLENAPGKEQVIPEFHRFIENSFLMAHHAPFDLGFVAFEFERLRLRLPSNPVFCTSLLSRKLFPESENHRLQTLIKYFGLTAGQAHRALDDAKACLEVGLKCFQRAGERALLEEIARHQETPLTWLHFSCDQLRSHIVFRTIVEAVEKNQPLQIVYNGGSRPGEARTVQPHGLVRTPNGDFLVALEEDADFPKRFFLDKISAARF